MPHKFAKHRIATAGWVAVFLVAAFLAGDTVTTIGRMGLIGARPPLSLPQTILRMVIVVVTLALCSVFHSILERITLGIAAAAAASSALYGFGVRSAGLSAFRLVSHLIAYALIMYVAGRNALSRDSISRPPLRPR